MPLQENVQALILRGHAILQLDFVNPHTGWMVLGSTALKNLLPMAHDKGHP